MAVFGAGTVSPKQLYAMMATVLGILFALMMRRKSIDSSRARRSSPSPSSPTGKNVARKKAVKVDGVFLARLRALLKICIPTWFGKEGFNLFALTALLIIRTRLTVIIAQVTGENAKRLVDRDPRGFVSGVIDLGLWALPSSVVNAGLKYTTALLTQQFRSNLLHYMHEKYLTEQTAYAVNVRYRQQSGGDEQRKDGENAAGDKGKDGKVVARSDNNGLTIDNPDHRLTEDVRQFAEEVTEIFPDIFKPTIDVITFVLELSRNGGTLPPFLLISYYLLSGMMLKSVIPNFAKLTAKTAQKEGDLRAIHNQLHLHAEEVAFYRGESIERDNANNALSSLMKHFLHVRKMKAITDFIDAVLIKYGATCCGYAVCSIGVFSAKGKVSTPELTRIYIRSSQLYLPLAKAVGKLVMLHKKVTALAGYTSRVGELHEVFQQIHAEKKAAKGEASAVEQALYDIVGAPEVRLDNVDVVAPGGIQLIKDLTLRVTTQDHLLIMGSNGSGKSALMRCIAGLWPIGNGKIGRPKMADMMFLPQRTYLPTGTFRDQLIFPDSQEDMKRKGVSDEELAGMATLFGLKEFLEREDGFDAEQEWHDVFSGGQRQRVAMVRVLYHRPHIAFLDESTSAVSTEIEPTLYSEIKARGTSLVTVSHRDTLKKFHTHVLQLDGFGGYNLIKLEE